MSGVTQRPFLTHSHRSSQIVEQNPTLMQMFNAQQLQFLPYGFPPPCDGPEFSATECQPELPPFDPMKHRLTRPVVAPIPPPPPVIRHCQPRPVKICSFLKKGWCYSWRHQVQKKEHPPHLIRCMNLGLEDEKEGSMILSYILAHDCIGCSDAKCPYLHPNPKNKYYKRLWDNYSEQKVSLEKRKSSSFYGVPFTMTAEGVH